MWKNSRFMLGFYRLFFFYFALALSLFTISFGVEATGDMNTQKTKRTEIYALSK